METVCFLFSLGIKNNDEKSAIRIRLEMTTSECFKFLKNERKGNKGKRGQKRMKNDFYEIVYKKNVSIDIYI